MPCHLDREGVADLALNWDRHFYLKGALGCIGVQGLGDVRGFEV